MDKKNTIKILAVLAIIVLLSSCASAFFGGLFAAVKGIWKGIKVVPWLVGEGIAEACKQVAKWWIVFTAWTALTFLEGIFDNMQSLLTTNPPMSEIFSGMLFFMKILAPFYVLAILILAIYLLIGSSSVRGRAKAKSMLSKLIIGLILVSISPGVLEVLFLISENLTKALMPAGATMGIGVLRDASNGLWWRFLRLAVTHREGGLEIFIYHSTLLMGLTTLLLLREAMVILFGMLLPLAFFLYSFYPTKHIGKDLFIQTFLWTFTPVAWALSLIIIGFGISTIPSYILETYVGLGAFFFFLGAPMLIMGMGDWLGTLVFMFELLQAAPLSIGAVVIDETMK